MEGVAQGSGEQAVASLLKQVAAAKDSHYVAAARPGGPFAPGTAKCEAFIVETGGRLAPSATAILRSWAQVAAGDEPGGGALSPRALSHYKRTQRLISTTLQRWHACHLHQAAEWLAEDLGRLGPGGLTASTCAPAPVRLPRGLALADIGPAQATSAL